MRQNARDPGGPLISVVIPTFNRAALIGESVGSVLSQTLGDFEVVVVDNGGTDNTRDVVASLRDARVRYIWQPPTGLPAKARNRGIAEARGRYIAFLDSDDRWRPRKLEWQMACFARRPEAGLVYGDAVYFGGGPRDGRRLVHGLIAGHVFDELLQMNRFPTLTVVVPRAVIDEVGVFSDEPQLLGLEDYELWLRIAQRYPCYPVRRVVAEYRMHEANLWSSGVAQAEASMGVFAHVCATLRVSPEAEKRARAVHMARLAWNYLRAGRDADYERARDEVLALTGDWRLRVFDACVSMLGRGVAVAVVRAFGFH